MQHNDHLPVTRLEDGVFDVVVKDVDFVAADRREAETCARQQEKSASSLHATPVDSSQIFTGLKSSSIRDGRFRFVTIGMCLQRSLHPLLCDVGPDVKVFELGVAAVEVDDQRVLLDDALFLLLLSLSRLVALLHLLDDAEGVLQVGRGHRRVAGRLQVGRSVCAEGKRTGGDRGGMIRIIRMIQEDFKLQGYNLRAKKYQNRYSVSLNEHSENLVNNKDSHFFDKCGVGVGEDISLLSSQGAARDVEVDSQVGVVSFYRHTDVLEMGKKKEEHKIKDLSERLSGNKYIYTHI